MFQSRWYEKGENVGCAAVSCVKFVPLHSHPKRSVNIKMSQSENDICHSKLHFRPVVYQRFHFKWEEMFRKINYEKLQIRADIHKPATLLII
jgi:hemerythrin